MNSIVDLINIYKTSFTEIKDVLSKLYQNKIVSYKIRRTYYDLLKNLHISLSKYKDGVYSFDIYRDNSKYIIRVDGNKFTIPIKINTYFDNNDNIENLPLNYYVESNGKYLSTNKYALSIIDQVLVILNDITTCLTL